MDPMPGGELKVDEAGEESMSTSISQTDRLRLRAIMVNVVVWWELDGVGSR